VRRWTIFAVSGRYFGDVSVGVSVDQLGTGLASPDHRRVDVRASHRRGTVPAGAQCPCENIRLYAKASRPGKTNFGVWDKMGKVGKRGKGGYPARYGVVAISPSRITCPTRGLRGSFSSRMAAWYTKLAMMIAAC